jgi:hypothetical protein
MCIPAGVTFRQGLALFLAYARSHAAQWHDDASPHLLLALMTAFPCKDHYSFAVRLPGSIAKRAAKGETPYAIAKLLGIDPHTAAKYVR